MKLAEMTKRVIFSNATKQLKCTVFSLFVQSKIPSAKEQKNPKTSEKIFQVSIPSECCINIFYESVYYKRLFD